MGTSRGRKYLGKLSTMLLAYVDESYSRDFYYMAALLCPDHALQELAADLDAVTVKAASAYDEVSADAELHGYELFHGKADWEALRGKPRARIAIYRDTLAALASQPVHIIIRGVDRKRLTARYGERADDPHSIVLQHLLERIDECARYQQELALVIADELSQNDQQQHRKDFRLYRTSGTFGYRGHRLEHIVDTLHFAPSKASRLVQAADLTAFLARRILCEEDTDKRAIEANTSLWQHIEPRITHCWCWTP